MAALVLNVPSSVVQAKKKCKLAKTIHLSAGISLCLRLLEHNSLHTLLLEVYRREIRGKCSLPDYDDRDSFPIRSKLISKSIPGMRDRVRLVIKPSARFTGGLEKLNDS